MLPFEGSSPMQGSSLDCLACSAVLGISATTWFVGSLLRRHAFAFLEVHTAQSAASEVSHGVCRLFGSLHSAIGCIRSLLRRHVVTFLEVSTAQLTASEVSCDVALSPFRKSPQPDWLHWKSPGGNRHLRRHVVSLTKGCSLAWGLAPSIHIFLS